MNNKLSNEVIGFSAMGKPISENRRQNAYALCCELGLDSETAWIIVAQIANYLEHDKPYEAMNTAKADIDITGIYRIFAVLLAS